MDLWDLTKMLFRRWYVFTPVLLASLAMVFVVTQNVQPDYSAKGHLQLIPPPERPGTANQPAARPNNRWLDLGFPALGSAVILQAQSEEVLSDLAEAGYTDNFTVTMEYGTTYLTIEAIGTSREQATTTVQELMRVLDELVTKLQEQFSAPEQDQITTLALDNGDKVEAVTSKKKRVAVVAIGLALMLSVGSSIGLDALLRLRRRRQEKKARGDAEEPVFTASAPVETAKPVAAAPVPKAPVGESTVVIRPPGAVAQARPENGARVERPSRHEETARIYPARPPQAAPADTNGRRGEVAARAEIAARAEAARGDKREPVIVPLNGQNGSEPKAAAKNGSEHKANGRNGVVVSPVPRPAADNPENTIILPAPRSPRGNREDKN